jgi:FSR family fosmidomycin resistance protein-like MFS transporter
VQLPRSLLFYAVLIGHLTNDVFMSMGPVMLAFVGTHFLGANAAAIGLAISLRELIGAVAQPFFGVVTDRTGGRWLAALGVAWTALSMSAALVAALSANGLLTLFFYCSAALGSAAFHPVGTMYASTAQQSRAARNSSLFFLFGQIGLGAGPSVAGILLAALTLNVEGAIRLRPSVAENLPALLTLSLAALPAVLLMASRIPSRRAAHAAQNAQDDAPRARQAFTMAMFGTFVLFLAMLLMRSISHIGVVNFVPILFERRGWSVEQYGFLTSLYWIASAFSGVLLGTLADRHDRRRMIALSVGLGAPLLFLLPSAEGLAALLLALGAGALLGASFPLTVVMAQSLLPNAKGFAAGLTLGLIFGAGAIGNALIGFLADGIQGSAFSGIGIQATFQVVAFGALLAGLLALALPQRLSGRAQRAVPAAQAAD